MVGISIAGLGYGIALKVKHLGRKIVKDWRYQSIFVLALSTVFIILAQLIFNIQYFVSFGGIFPPGWFVYIAFTALALIFLLGFRTLINSILKRFKDESVLVAFIIFIIFSATTFYWLLPNYYMPV